MVEVGLDVGSRSTSDFGSLGFVMGTIDMADYKMRALSVELQVVIAMVEYRLAPEHPHPIPQNDCYDGLKWVGEHSYRDFSNRFLDST